eukprot:SAG31_NODE_2294_length_5991_cov_2.589613_8_plen_58_part_00
MGSIRITIILVETVPTLYQKALKSKGRPKISASGQLGHLGLEATFGPGRGLGPGRSS